MEYRWRLVYPTGSELDQPSELGSIRFAPRGAVELIVLAENSRQKSALEGKGVVFQEWSPVCAIRLRGKPLFYQQRSVGISVGGGLGNDLTSDWVAFGWWDEDHQQASLYTLDGAGYRPLPPERYRESMVLLQAGDD